VAHGNAVDVVNADTGAKIGSVAPAPGVHGIALVPGMGRGFASAATNREVIMFDLATLRTLKVIRYTGIKPDGIEYDPDTKRVYVCNGDSGDVTAIDPGTGDIVGTVMLGGKLEAMAFDGKGRMFVNAEDKSVIHVVDTHALELKANWPLAPAEGPTGLAFDRDHDRLFAACGNEKLAVVDSDTGAVVATPSIGRDPDGAAFDPSKGLIFTSNLEGTLSVLHEDSPDAYRTVQTLPTAYGARTIALDPSTGRVFLPSGRFGAAPAPTPADPEPRRPLLANSFEILVVGR
jgi:YVTN family beta-propeller protein